MVRFYNIITDVRVVLLNFLISQEIFYKIKKCGLFYRTTTSAVVKSFSFDPFNIPVIKSTNSTDNDVIIVQINRQCSEGYHPRLLLQLYNWHTSSASINII